MNIIWSSQDKRNNRKYVFLYQDTVMCLQLSQARGMKSYKEDYGLEWFYELCYNASFKQEWMILTYSKSNWAIFFQMSSSQLFVNGLSVKK